MDMSNGFVGLIADQSERRFDESVTMYNCECIHLAYFEMSLNRFDIIRNRREIILK